MRLAAVAAAAIVALASAGCGRSPSPLTPSWYVGGLGGASVGVPHRGALVSGAELPREGTGFRWLRNDDRHFGLPRFVSAIERAAMKVERERPGGKLSVGDLSKQSGGVLLPHLSHRTGRDADLLLYVQTLEGAPVESPGFVHFGPDGLAWDDKGRRFLRLDVERQWLLVKTLLEDEQARIQWVFANRHVRALLLEWARARGDSADTIVRAMETMLQPNPGGPHDDHIHIRTACTPAEIVAGCETTGPQRPWIDLVDRRALAAASAAPSTEADAELARLLCEPIARGTTTDGLAGP